MPQQQPEQPKRLKIVGRKVVSGLDGFQPDGTPNRSHGGRTLGPMGKKAIALFVENGGRMPVGKAMRAAGYREATIKNPKNLTRSPEFKDAVMKFTMDLEEHRRTVLEKMKSKVNEAEYGTLAFALSSLTRDIQLLTGRVTGRIGFVLPESQKQEILDLMELNQQ